VPVLIDPQGIFEDPGCPVITRIGDLPGILERLSAAVDRFQGSQRSLRLNKTG
jgi:hypothetical protein